jgi:hypothetical protein
VHHKEGPETLSKISDRAFRRFRLGSGNIAKTALPVSADRAERPERTGLRLNRRHDVVQNVHVRLGFEQVAVIVC